MSNNNITQLEEYYKTPKEVSEALKVKDLPSLIKGYTYTLLIRLAHTHIFLTGLSKLRTQLSAAVKVRVDPTEKHTRPLVEYCQSCTDSHELSSLWDYQTSVNT